MVGDVHAVGHGHEDGQFVGGVDTLDVVARVGLGEPQPLRLGEHLGKGYALVGHAGEDVVGRAVHDAHDRQDAVGHQPLLEGLDHRDAAADAGLEADLHAFRGRGREDVAPLLGEQRLVGGDHVLAGLDGLEDKGLGRLDAADQLDNNVDLWVADQIPGIPGERDVAEPFGQGVGAMVGDAGQADGHPGAPDQPLLLRQQHFRQALAHRAKTDYAHPDLVHRLLSPAEKKLENCSRTARFLPSFRRDVKTYAPARSQARGPAHFSASYHLR